jgi:hypothetical protein
MPMPTHVSGLEEARVAGHEPSPRPDAVITECTLEQQVVPVAARWGTTTSRRP